MFTHNTEHVDKINVQSWGTEGSQVLVFGKLSNVIVATPEDCDEVIKAAVLAKEKMIGKTGTCTYCGRTGRPVKPCCDRDDHEHLLSCSDVADCRDTILAQLAPSADDTAAPFAQAVADTTGEPYAGAEPAGSHR